MIIKLAFILAFSLLGTLACSAKDITLQNYTPLTIDLSPPNIENVSILHKDEKHPLISKIIAYPLKVFVLPLKSKVQFFLKLSI